MSFLSDAFSAGSKTAKKTRRKERRIETTSANASKIRVKHAREDFLDQENLRKLQINEAFAARGMAGGTHATEMNRLQDAAAKRVLHGMDYDKLLADQSADLTDYTHKTRNRMNPLKIIDFAIDAGMAGIGLGAGLGIGGAAGAAGATGTFGLDEAFLDID